MSIRFVSFGIVYAHMCQLFLRSRERLICGCVRTAIIACSLCSMEEAIF